VLRVAYFGPAGTFTEEALLSQADLAAGKRTPHGSVPEVIAAVERGDVDGAWCRSRT
jgi:prephenate dehydratase